MPPLLTATTEPLKFTTFEAVVLTEQPTADVPITGIQTPAKVPTTMEASAHTTTSTAEFTDTPTTTGTPATTKIQTSTAVSLSLPTTLFVGKSAHIAAL